MFFMEIMLDERLEPIYINLSYANFFDKIFINLVSPRKITY